METIPFYGDAALSRTQELYEKACSYFRNELSMIAFIPGSHSPNDDLSENLFFS
jgi:hypothetical protein